MDSKILGRNVNYAVYLPPDYDSSTRRYPVVYLLHGYTDDETAWIQFGEVNIAADKAIQSRDIPPMIIVMPDAKVTYYVNDYRGTDKYEDMFIQEFVPFIDSEYRTRTEKRYRGISGLSMGGYGSLMYAMRYPDMFAACAAFSSALRDNEAYLAVSEDRFNNLFQKLYGGTIQNRITEHWRSHNPIDMAKTLEPESLKKVRYYIDCGDDDSLIRGNCTLHLILKDREIPHEFRVRDGGHQWIYWRTGIVEGLKFIGFNFNE
ncbi:esterase family protein [candidate division KSB1 bacterium]|nr:esterase family protein [candidate division KSB1 bacterium]